MKLHRIQIVRTFYVLAEDAESAEDLATLEPPNPAEQEIYVSRATEKSLYDDKWLYVDAYGGPEGTPCHQLLKA